LQVKAQGLLNSIRWIEDQYGRETRDRVVAACSPGVQERCATAIAINWHPMAELVEMLERAEEHLGNGDGRIAERMGAAAARANLKGVVIRFAFYLAKPQFMLERLAGLWNRFNDKGALAILRVDASEVSFEVSGVPEPHRYFCAMMTGWGNEVATTAGLLAPRATHIECRARGEARCVWRIRGKPPILS
jgi:hypothetical protein